MVLRIFFFNGKILISGTWEFEENISYSDLGITGNYGSLVKFKSNGEDFIGMSLEETNNGTIYYAQWSDQDKGTMVYGTNLWIDDGYRTISLYEGQYVYPNFLEILTKVAKRIA